MVKKFIKLLFVALLMIVGEFVYNITSNLIAGSQPVKKFVHKVELYCGVNILEKEPIIADFKSTEAFYHISENISFTLKLNKEAFVYLLNISKQSSNVAFPNNYDLQNHYQKSKLYKLPSRNYNIIAEQRGVEAFYLVASEIQLSFSDFDTLSQSEAKERIEDLKKSCLVDVFRLDVKVD